MSDLNTVSVTGNIVRFSELRRTPDGTAVCDLSLACNGLGDEVVFLGIIVWGKAAEALTTHKSTGDKLAVSGRLTQDNWIEKESGQKRSKTKISAERIHFLPSGRARQENN